MEGWTVTCNPVRDAEINLGDRGMRLRAAVVVLSSPCVVVTGDVVVLIGQRNRPSPFPGVHACAWSVEPQHP